MAARAAVTPSPEPFSNIALSLTGDGMAVILTWLSTWKPYVAAGIAVVLVVIALVLIYLMWHAIRLVFRGAHVNRDDERFCAAAEVGVIRDLVGFPPFRKERERMGHGGKRSRKMNGFTRRAGQGL